MQYRQLGDTGLRVSTLGFGAMRLPEDPEYAVEVMKHALDLGVNLIDTAPGYCGELSEKLVGKAMSGRRSSTIVSTKYRATSNSTKDLRQSLETSLEHLGVEQIDIFNFWGVRWQAFQEFILDGPLQAARKAQDEGIIKHLGFSFHDTPQALERLINTGEFACMIVQYNLLDRSNEKAIRLAREKGMGVMVMGPIGGGRLTAPSDRIRTLVSDGFQSTPEAALRFVLANPDVSTALSGMNTIAMVEENLEHASHSTPLTSQERAQIEHLLEDLSRLAELYCTGCGYCLPCEHEVNIPEVFRLANLIRVWGLEDYATTQYATLGQEGSRTSGQGAVACMECGACEERCPQDIKIVSQLQEAHRLLTPGNGS